MFVNCLLLVLASVASTQAESINRVAFTPLEIDNHPCKPENLKKTVRYICNSDGQVLCNHGWTEDPNEDPMLNPCSIPVCQPECDKGECIAPGICACEIGWEGKACDVCINLPGCKFGSCNEDGVPASLACKCSVGWEGGLCDRPSCSQGCVNGHCTAPNTCTCYPGWTGPDCNTCVPLEGCNVTNGLGCVNSVGTSVAFGCFCNNKFEGPTCSDPKCSPPCVNGQCRLHENNPVCVCDFGWEGASCSDCTAYDGCSGTCVDPSDKKGKPFHCFCNGTTFPCGVHKYFNAV